MQDPKGTITSQRTVASTAEFTATLMAIQAIEAVRADPGVHNHRAVLVKHLQASRRKRRNGMTVPVTCWQRDRHRVG